MKIPLLLIFTKRCDEMAKPYLLIVTGRPGAGKTTFAQTLGDEIFMPVISRDKIKEGYVHSFGKKHSELPPEANGTATEIFFNTLKMLIENNVSVIAEAAFQHEVWSSALEWFADMARVYFLICTVDKNTALERFISRGLQNPLREHFHGDKGVNMARGGLAIEPSIYDEPHMDVPTIHIDTTAEYEPSIKALSELILSKK